MRLSIFSRKFSLAKLTAAGAALLMSSVALDNAKAATPLTLDISGFYYTGIASANRNGEWPRTNIAQDGEIHFKVTSQLDTGMELGLQVELEAMDMADAVDESYVYLQGGFGKVILGAENGAAYLNMVNAPKFVPGTAQFDNNLGEATIENNLTIPTAAAPAPAVVGDPQLLYVIDDVNMSTPAEGISGDELKVVYITPRVNGARLGVSYSPNNGNMSGGSNNVTDMARQNDILSFSVDYKADFNPDGYVKASYGYTTGDNNNTALGLTTPELVALADDPVSQNFGLQVGYGAFTVGGAHSSFNNFRGIRARDIRVTNFAVAYDMGRTQVGIGFTDSKDDGLPAAAGLEAARAAVDYQEWMIGGGTKIADGIAVGYYYQDAEAKYIGNVKRDVSIIGATLALVF